MRSTVALGAFIVMIGASILLSGLLIFTAPIISDLYYLKDAAGQVVLRTLPSGARVPVEINGGQGAFLIYFTIMTVTIVIPVVLRRPAAGKVRCSGDARCGRRSDDHRAGDLCKLHGKCDVLPGGCSPRPRLRVEHGAHSGRFDQQLVCRQTRPRPRHRARRVRCWRRDLGGNRPLSRHLGTRVARGIQIMAVAMAICTVLPALFLIRGQPRRRRVAPVRRGRNTSRRAGG